MSARLASGLCLSALFALLFCPNPLRAQGPEGPISAPPKYETKRIPLKLDSPPPSIPVDELIHRVISNEDAMKQAYEHFQFMQTLRIQELANPGGTYSATGVLYTKADGQRYEHLTGQPSSTLKFADVGTQSLGPIRGMPLFLLTSAEAPNYDIQYMGKEKLDELSTYILRVKPKQLERARKFFDGIVWVEDQDLTIVKTSGQWVNDVSDSDGDQLPFRMFDVYRENIEGKYWFPTYVSSDDYLKVQGHDDVHMHLVVRSTDFKLEPPGTNGPMPDNSSSQPPSSDANEPVSPAAQPSPDSSQTGAPSGSDSAPLPPK